MPRLKHKVPNYCRHRASGQAVVTIDGRDVYLGPFGSMESKQKYEQTIARLLASRQAPGLRTCSRADRGDDLRVSELLVAYMEFAEQYDRKYGCPTGEFANIKDAVRPLALLYNDLRVSDFGPVDLKFVRQGMIDAALSRKVINARVNRRRRVFRWGVENQFVEPSVLQALQAVTPLKKGRSAAARRLT